MVARPSDGRVPMALPTAFFEPIFSGARPPPDPWCTVAYEQVFEDGSWRMRQVFVQSEPNRRRVVSVRRVSPLTNAGPDSSDVARLVPLQSLVHAVAARHASTAPAEAHARATDAVLQHYYDGTKDLVCAGYLVKHAPVGSRFWLRHMCVQEGLDDLTVATFPPVRVARVVAGFALALAFRLLPFGSCLLARAFWLLSFGSCLLALCIGSVHLCVATDCVCVDGLCTGARHRRRPALRHDHHQRGTCTAARQQQFAPSNIVSCMSLREVCVCVCVCACDAGDGFAAAHVRGARRGVVRRVSCGTKHLHMPLP